MPDALHCRLMQICLATYSGTLPRFVDVAWTDIVAGTTATSCGGGSDFAFVGEIKDPRGDGKVDRAIVIAIRGTLEPFKPDDPDSLLTIRDWLNDADSFQVPFTEVPGAGNVHKGFHDSLNVMWSQISKAVKDLIAAGGPGKRLLLITGHSKGGAIANLVALRAHQDWKDEVDIEVVTFAGARAGDLQFQTAYNANVPNSVRYESWPDPVPELPPGPQGSWMLSFFAVKLAKSIGGLNVNLKLAYYPVGRRIPPSAGWGADMWSGILKLLAGTMPAAMQTVRNVHRIGKCTGYADLACVDPCPKVGPAK